MSERIDEATERLMDWIDERDTAPGSYVLALVRIGFRALACRVAS